MKKILKSMVVAMIMVCSMSASIFANTAEDLRKELLAAGVPSSYVGAVVEYLQKTTISQADYNKAMGYINEAKAIISEIKDISELSDSDKLAIKNLATKAGNTLGLEVTFGRENGVTTLVITDVTGSEILNMSTLDAIESVTDFHPSTYIELVETMVEFTVNSRGEEFTPVGGNEEFIPVGGELTQTATQYANMMIVGAVMVVVAGGIALVSKKQFA